MNVQGQPPPPNMDAPPPSPWFRKYGGGERNVLKTQDAQLTHSGVAPFFPMLHATFYAEENAAFAHLQPFPLPTDPELDILFATEANQLERNGGLTTWEMGILREHLVNGWRGGHRRADPAIQNILESGDGVSVDESAWNPIFARNKWYDLRVPIVDGKKYFSSVPPGISPTDVWSVDVPRVWDELRVSLELANRWFREMANGPWLNSMFNENREEWMAADPLPSELEYPEQLGPNNKPLRIPVIKDKEYDSGKTLRDIAVLLTPKLVWTFVDDGHHTFDEADSGDYYGRTVRHWQDGEEPREDTPLVDRKAPFITVYIHVQMLRVLLNPGSTLAERCQARWSLAMTMLHEVMHAINIRRHLHALDLPAEPYYDEEWDRELGSSAIKSIFGGEFVEAPVTDAAWKSGYKYGLALTEFPTPPGNEPIARLNQQPVSHLGQATSTFPLPAAWSSAMLLESFYKTHVKQYGLAAFKAPRLLQSTRTWRGFYVNQTRAEPIHATIHPAQAELLPQFTRTLDDLQSRRQLWDRLRPWYFPAQQQWLATPYAHISARAIVSRFADAAQPWKRAAAGEHASHLAEREAGRAASGMYYWLWRHTPRPGLDMPLAESREWVFLVLALMMQAVLPARHEVGYAHDAREVANPWVPSQAAKKAGNGVWRFEERRLVFPELRGGFMLPERHQAGHPIYDAEGNQIEYETNRTWLLERALDVKQRCEVVYPLPGPLAQALEQGLTALFRQNGQEKEDDEWMDWEFEFPPYSSQLFTRDNEGGFVPRIPPPPLYAQGQGQVQAGAAQVAAEGRRRSGAGRGKKQPRRYFTVSEVGEKVSEDASGPNWALLSDRVGGYDVFDVADILSNDPSIDVEKALKPTELGRQIVSRRIKKALQAREEVPLGKLLTWKRPEEVAERDGQDGRELWCTIGSFVYDITDLPFESNIEKEALTALATRTKVQADALKGVDMKGLLARLAPYKCGYLQQAAPSTPAKERPFTLRELGRHIFPEVGMYCAIDGYVYDLGRYLHSHPGGAQILRDYAGRDATDDFVGTHFNWEDTLEANTGLVVGYIVEERARSVDVNDDEIALLDRVFYFAALFRDNRPLYNQLEPYAGTDATAALSSEPALQQLLAREDLICAKRVNDAHKRITTAQLQARNHIPDKEGRRKDPGPGDSNWRVWVAVGEGDGSRRQMVYDVTAMIMFGGDELEQQLRPWLGKTVRDAELAEELRSQRASFIIGELVGGDSRGSVSARKGQAVGSRRRSLAGSKRGVGALDDCDLEVLGPRTRKRSRSRDWR